MKQNRIHLKNALRLALVAISVILSCSTLSYGQTIDRNGDCFTIAVTTTVACGGTCTAACDHCATFTFTNVSTNCDITDLEIKAVNGPPGSGITAAECWQTCSPQGSPDYPGCTTDVTKNYSGHYPPGGTNNLANTFTICYSGTGPKYFSIKATGAKWVGTGDECICATSAGVHF